MVCLVVIVRGTCVGVSYRASSGASCRNGYCVHNGRLVGGVTSITNNTINVTTSVQNTNLSAYQGILLSHLAVNPITGQVTQQYLFINRNRLQSVRVTPYTKYRDANCHRESHYNIPDIIYPGECVGIRFFVNNRYEISNGRYLYWQGATNHCRFNERPQSTNRRYVRQIWYSHWILNPNNPADIIDQKKSRGRGAPGNEHRIYVFKLRDPFNGEIIPVTPILSNRRNLRIIYH